MSYAGPITKTGALGDTTLLGLSPLTEVEIARRLAECGLGTTVVETAVEGATLGAKSGRNQWGPIIGATLGLGVVAWAFWRSRPEEAPTVTIRASTDSPSDPPGDSLVAALPVELTSTAAANDNNIAKVVSAPFVTQQEAEAELVKRLAAETKVFSSPYAIIQDTQTGYYYVCEVLSHDFVTSSFWFVTYGVKLGDKQTEADAIPPLAALEQANGEPLRVIGVWSDSQFVITTTSPVTHTLNPSVAAFHVQFELHNHEKVTLYKRVMLTFPDRSYIKFWIDPSDLRDILRSGRKGEIDAYLNVQTIHAITKEPFSILSGIKLPVRPGVGAVTIDLDPGTKVAQFEYYSSGDIVFRIPSLPGKPIPVYLPMPKQK